MTLKRLLPLALLLPGPAFAQVSAQPKAAEAISIATSSARPALWRVQDEDTTIFLFGTVHALPQGVNWLQGTVAGALLSSDTLATEVLPETLTDPAFLKRYAKISKNPEGTTLRGLLDASQRARFEAGLRQAGLDPAAFDAYKPWFAANALVLAPLLKKGYSTATGSEQSIAARAPAKMRRVALETAETQIEMFDSLPPDVQVSNLLQVVEQMHTVNTRVDRTVEAWLKGDMATVAVESESEDDDPRMAEVLLYPRNKAWADWIVRRLAKPGRVFVAVGAGHLAGAKSVQAALAERGVAVTRLQ